MPRPKKDSTKKDKDGVSDSTKATNSDGDVKVRKSPAKAKRDSLKTPGLGEKVIPSREDMRSMEHMKVPEAESKDSIKEGEVLEAKDVLEEEAANSEKSKWDIFQDWNPNFRLLDSVSEFFSGNKMTSNDGEKKMEEAEELASLNKAVYQPLRAGIIVSFLFFGVFGAWAVLAPIDSAAVATGFVVLDSNKKTVQHLEGGIIEEILVAEGDEVEEGQVLIRLNETTAEARQALVEGQMIASQATEARLIAERDNLETIVFPEDLWKRRLEPEIFDILDGEQRLFETRKKALNGHVQVLRQRIEQLNDEISGLQAQELASRDQLALIREEILVVQKLLASGDANRPRLLALQRKSAELEGNRGEYLSLIAKAKQAITETELEVINIQNKNLNEIVAQLRETQTKISDLQERGRASKDILDRIIIAAPQSGIVTGLKYHTVGGVIAPGAPIMDIVPQDDILVIEARVSPQDIDVVTKGLKARVRLTAFKVRKVPPLDGEVTHVSPDKFVDEVTGQSYYKAKIRISDKVLSSLVDHIELHPGMPADVLIVTGERTFMTYMMSPITDSFGKAFREQ